MTWTRATRRGRWLASAATISVVIAVNGGAGGTTAAASSPTTEPPATACPGTFAGTDPQPLAEPTKVTLSSPAAIEAFAPVYLALADGEFEKENLEVEIITIQTATQSLALGEIDGAFTAPAIETINAVSQGVVMKWIAGNYSALPDTQIGVFARAELVDGDDFSGLAGEKLALAGNTGITLVTIQRILQSRGLEMSDVEITRLAPADSLIALENGAIGAAWLNAPINLEVADDPDFVFVGGQDPEMVGGGLLVGERLLDPENCQVTVALVRAMQRVIDDKLAPGYHSDPDVVAQLADLFQVPAEVIADGEELVFTQQIPDWVIPTFQDVLVEQGLLEPDARVEPSELVDTSFVSDVLLDRD